MISKELLKRVLLEQRRKIEESIQDNLVIREKLREIKCFINIKNSLIITGVRRCGKSIFLTQIINNFFKEYYYINFEDERLAGFDLKDFDLLYETCIELFGSTKYFFLDEIQNIKGWERWVRRMYDDGFKFFITGSNAMLLSKELATLLTGRHLQFSIYPFSFKEFLDLKGISLDINDLYLTEKRAKIIKYFNEYIKTGGFPQYLKDNKIEILQEYFNDIIQRDIAERYKIDKVNPLKELARYLITNSGNPATYNNLSKITDITSVNTIIKYLSALENAYLILKIPFFSYSLKKQMMNPFKVYVIDHGLINAISFKFSEDIGKIYETIVAIELKRRNKEVYYWKNVQHEEVDFVIKEGLRIKQLVQVCYRMDDPNTKKREIKALIKASKELKCNSLIILTEEKDEEEKIEGKKIKFMPLYKYLLMASNKSSAY